jgi:hypothetical protein
MTSIYNTHNGSPQRKIRKGDQSLGRSSVKGWCQEMNRFFRGSKNQTSTFCTGADGLHNNLLLLFGEDHPKINFVLIASLLTVNIMPVTLFRKLVPAFPIAAFDSESCFEERAACNPEKLF